MSWEACCVAADALDLVGARVLAADLARVAPGVPLTVLVLPGLPMEIRASSEPFEAIGVRALGVPELAELAARAPKPLVAAAARPLLLSYLLRTGAQRAVLLAPDTEVHAAPDELLAALDDAALAVVPRTDGPLADDGHRPDQVDLIEAGHLDDAHVAARADADDALDWWAARALGAARVGSALGRHDVGELGRLTASSLDGAPDARDDVAVLDHRGYDVSVWNLHQRPLAERDGTLLAGDAPLRTMRWTGFRADRPWWLSELGTRVSVLDDALLEARCAARAQALLDAGWQAAHAAARTSDRLPNGLLYDERLQRLWARAVEDGELSGSPFDRGTAEMFTRWMAEPASAGGRHGITRFAQEVWVLRPDVQEAYPDLDDAATAEGFIGWLWAHGRPELDLPRSLLGTPPAWLEIETGEVPLVVEVVGYLRGNLGLGSAARGYVDVLEAAGATVATKALRLDAPIARRGGALPPRLESHSHEERTLAGGAQAPVVLLCVNADQTPEAHRELGLGDAPERYVIGNWAWETDHVPDRWEPAFRLVDELWVYSNYIADTLARHSDVPVLVMPLPIRPPDPQGARVPFEVDDRFAFLFAFDHFSTAARKNPMGLVRAYLQAFPKPSPAGPQLVLKTINAQYRPQDHAELRAAIGGRDDVTLVDAMLEPGEMAALFHRADAYVSLHRAEGYGLTLADSMALGKPVIGTAATGNLDFMTSANSFLVEAEPVPVGPDAEHYAHAGATWFEPSIDHAATLMRQVFEDRDEAARRGARAKVDISTQLSVEAVAERARQRLHHLSGRLGGAGPAGATPLTRTVDKAVAKAYAPVGLAPLASRPRAALRTAVLRAIQPYTAHEQQVDRALATGLTGLAGELEALRSARERDRDRLRALERRLAELERRSP